MANPIIGQPDAFTKHAQQGYVPQQYAGQGYVQDPQLQYQQVPQPGGVMTLDDVIAKSAITLGAVFAAAAATWMLLPVQLLYPALLVSAIAGFVTVLFVAGRRKVPVGHTGIRERP